MEGRIFVVKGTEYSLILIATLNTQIIFSICLFSNIFKLFEPPADKLEDAETATSQVDGLEVVERNIF